MTEQNFWQRRLARRSALGVAALGAASFGLAGCSGSDKKATATSHGNNRFRVSPGVAGGPATALELAGIILPARRLSGRAPLPIPNHRTLSFQCENLRMQSATQ